MEIIDTDLYNIDPITLRSQEPEKLGIISRIASLFTLVECNNVVPKAQMLRGGDVSQWQGTMDWNKYFDAGMSFVFIRAMINGNPDPSFDTNANTLTNQNRWFGCYGATGYPTLANAIPYAKTLADLVDGVGNLAIWWDSEASGSLTPSQMKQYNELVMGELEARLSGRILEIYTRQSFWDSHVAASDWNIYPLSAARYYESLDCPWGDGKYIFRDWATWRYWQYSQWLDGKKYGATSPYIDGNLFNGDEETLKSIYNLGETEPPGDLDEVWKAIELLTDKVTELDSVTEQNLSDIADHQIILDNHEERISNLEKQEDDPEYITVKVTSHHKAHYFKVWDKSCEDDPEHTNGKPTMLTDNELEPMADNSEWLCYAKVGFSCHDDWNDPIMFGDGFAKYFRIAQEGPYHNKFIRFDKSEIIR